MDRFRSCTFGSGYRLCTEFMGLLAALSEFVGGILLILGCLHDLRASSCCVPWQWPLPCIQPMAIHAKYFLNHWDWLSFSLACCLSVPGSIHQMRSGPGNKIETSEFNWLFVPYRLTVAFTQPQIVTSDNLGGLVLTRMTPSGRHYQIKKFIPDSRSKEYILGQCHNFSEINSHVSS